ncbi:MAG: TetR/AcrR family transcriptional regulator [Gemmatimonadota bacterium]
MTVTRAEHLDIDGRRPSQERGTRRVELILDAAAALIGEVGVEGLTVQLLAERAETSKGSLYHFFPDVAAVLRALGERHFRAISATVVDITNDPSLDWPRMPARNVVAALLAPLDYLERNCDLLALVRAPGVLPRSSRSMQPMLDLVDFVLAARFPSMAPERRATRSAMLVAMIDGVVGTAARGCSRNGREMRQELEELLASYLISLSTTVSY